MARLPRIDYPGARHHVMNRGARRQPVFLDDSWYGRFLQLLDQMTERHGLVVHGYALLPNHFHLMLECPNGNVSRGVQFLTSRYALWLNQAHDWDGSVFRGRFTSRVVADDRYWQHLLAYLHLNPVRAGLVGTPADSRWTSHRAYVDLDATPPWLRTDELLESFGGREAYRRYIRSVWLGTQIVPSGFDESSLYARPPGSQLRPRDEPAPVGAATALAEVSYVTGTTLEELQQRRPGPRGQPERWLAMWWLARRSGLPLSTVGRILGTDPAQVSRALARFRRRRRTSRRLDGWACQLLDEAGFRATWGERPTVATARSGGSEGRSGGSEGRTDDG